MSVFSKKLLPFYLLFLLLTYLVKDNSFFWDSILLASYYGQWYYDTNFSRLFVPEDIAGYPPLFGMYLALGWKIFGKTLAVSHFLMLPFLLGIVVQVGVLVRQYIRDKFQFWAVLLVLLEPTLLAQAAQVAPDIAVVFLYLLCLNCILLKRRFLFTFSVIFLGMLSPRGMILVAALFLTELFLCFIRPSGTGSGSLRRYLLLLARYIPVFVVTAGWLLLHYLHFSWMLYNPDSAWGQGTEVVGVKGFFWNTGIIIWRFIDLGRLSVFLFLLVMFLYLFRKREAISRQLQELLLLILAPVVVLSAVLVFYTNPIAHRYYLVVFLLLLLLAAYFLQNLPSARRMAVYFFLLISLTAGHYTVLLYPEERSKGWDATLAHLPYYKLRGQIIRYIRENNIPTEAVGSAFPNLRPFKYTDLVPDTGSFTEKDLTQQQYILHSNIFNDFTDEELDMLRTEWEVMQEYRQAGIRVSLYRRK